MNTRRNHYVEKSIDIDDGEESLILLLVNLKALPLLC